MQDRNQLFDFYKGIAIILVVAGHTLQYIIYPTNFDESLGFRLIYSFHMPLFVFISGMVSSLWIIEFDGLADLKSNLLLSIRRLMKSAVRLMLPFISWTIFKYFYYSMEIGVIDYVFLAFEKPDESLWFLPCIFMCILFWVFCQTLISLTFSVPSLRKTLEQRVSKKSQQLICQFILILLIWLSLKDHIHYQAGDLLKAFFTYFFLGVIASHYLIPHLTRWKRIFPYAIFVILGPLWYRNTNNHLPASLYDSLGQAATKYYAIITALSGSLAVLDASKMLYKSNWLLINKMIEYCGKISLGIYAIHFYVLHIGIPVIAPVAISVIASAIILQIPILRTLLLGEPINSKQLGMVRGAK